MKRSIVSPGFVKRTLAKLLKLDQQLGIVVDGDVASKAIAVGKYVNLINSTITGKQDGIYVATGAVSSGGTVTAADISGNAVTEGVTNDLYEQIGRLTTNPDWVVVLGFTSQTSDTQGYVQFTYKGTTLNTSNCAGLWPSINNDGGSYHAISLPFYNSSYLWRARVVDGRDLSSSVPSQNVNIRYLAYISKSIL